MKKIFLLILCGALLFGCSESVSNSDVVFFNSSSIEGGAQNATDSFYVGVLRYDGTGSIFEMSANQENRLFYSVLGDGGHYTIRRNFFVDTVVFSVSIAHAGCFDPNFTYKMDGKKLDVNVSTSGRVAIALPDTGTHSIEVSAPSTCRKWSNVFDIVPSEKPGSVFRSTDIFYLKMSPSVYNMQEIPYKKGSLFFHIEPSVESNYYMGDTVLSKCKLFRGDDTLIIPISFEKYKDRLGVVADVNVDSAQLVNFMGSEKQASIICPLYYQSWYVFKSVDSVKYFGPFRISFMNDAPQVFIGEKDGDFKVLCKAELKDYHLVVRVRERTTKQFLYNTLYHLRSDYDEPLKYFYPVDALGKSVDIDSVYVYVFPVIWATKESMNIVSNIKPCEDHNRWAKESQEQTEFFEKIHKDYFTDYKDFNPRTWMSMAEWEKEKVLTREDTIGFKGEYLKFVDVRDSTEYKAVSIGGLYWMAENLKYVSEESSCYMDSTEYCDAYGRYYPMDGLKSICPEGWRVPFKKDFETLLLHTGEDSIGTGILSNTYHKAYTKLMSISGWKSNTGEDKFGFGAYPYGAHHQSYGIGTAAAYWSYMDGYVFLIEAGNGTDMIHLKRDVSIVKRNVRCISDSTDDFFNFNNRLVSE